MENDNRVNEDPNRVLVDANTYIKRGEFDKAKNLLNQFVNTYTSIYKEDDTKRYFCFRNVVEFYCATSKLKINKDMQWIAYNISDAYGLLSYIYTEEKNYSMARECSLKAIYYNPMNANMYFEKSESYKAEKDYNKMLSVTKEAYDYIYNPKDLARYYRNLGFCYIESGKYEEAYAMYIVSLNFESNDRAMGEIGYISVLTNNKNFTVSLDKIKEILVKENVPYGIKEENKIALLSFITREEFSRYPKLIDSIKKDIEVLTRKMKSTEEILAENEEAKITTDDLIDESKIIKDELDITREKKNIEYLKSIGVQTGEGLKTVPVNSQTKLASKQDVVRIMLIDYVIGYLCTEAASEPEESLNGVLDAIDSIFQVRKLFNENDNKFINSILNKELSEETLNDASWLYEECSVLMWCLNLIEKPSLKNECSTNRLFEVLSSFKSYNELLEKSVLRDKEEIMEFDDLVTRALNACRDARSKGQTIEVLNDNVLIEFRIALDQILGWSINKVMKDWVNVNYKRIDFDFNFNIPTILTFDSVAPKKDRKCLFSLVSANKLTVITLLDLGKTLPGNFNIKYSENVTSYKEDNWNVIRERSYRFENLEYGVKELVINKIIPPVDIPVLGLTRYYFMLNDHIVCLEVLLEKDINYQDSNSINNSINSRLALSILHSLVSNK